MLAQEQRNQPVVPAQERATGLAAEQHNLNPVLADVLAEKEPDTVSWVKG